MGCPILSNWTRFGRDNPVGWRRFGQQLDIVCASVRKKRRPRLRRTMPRKHKTRRTQLLRGGEQAEGEKAKLHDPPTFWLHRIRRGPPVSRPVPSLGSSACSVLVLATLESVGFRRPRLQRSHARRCAGVVVGASRSSLATCRGGETRRATAKRKSGCTDAGVVVQRPRLPPPRADADGHQRHHRGPSVRRCRAPHPERRSRAATRSGVRRPHRQREGRLRRPPRQNEGGFRRPHRRPRSAPARPWPVPRQAQAWGRRQ